MLRLIVINLSLLGLIGWDSELFLAELLVMVMIMTIRALDEFSVGGRHKA